MITWKNKFVHFLGVAALLSSSVFAVIEGKSTPLYLAVLDLEQVLEQAKTPEGLRISLEAKRAEYQIEISSLEAQLREAYDMLSKEGAALTDTVSQEAYEAKRRAFEERVAGVHRKVAERRKELEAFHAMHMAPIQEALGQVITKISESRGISLVMPRSAAVFREDSLDLTLDVIEALNEALPSFEALRIKVASLPAGDLKGQHGLDVRNKGISPSTPSATSLRLAGEKAKEHLRG
ncbi:MAG: OmpH family outer membrane protein [bacterium]|nr:OmpH family outer membrane protein [bacterium]